MKKRITALLLVLVMMLSLLMTAAFAAETETMPAVEAQSAVLADENEGETTSPFISRIANIDTGLFLSWIAAIFSLVQEYSTAGLAVVILNGIGLLFSNN